HPRRKIPFQQANARTGGWRVRDGARGNWKQDFDLIRGGSENLRTAALIRKRNDGRGRNVRGVEVNVPKCGALWSEIGRNTIEADRAAGNDRDCSDGEPRVVGLGGRDNGDVLRSGAGASRSGRRRNGRRGSIRAAVVDAAATRAA